METISIHDPWGPAQSRLREQLLEHQLLGEIVRRLALAGRRCEVLRAEFDGSGHDVALEEGEILRHVQLKAMRADGKRAHVNIHTALSAKPSGCVIWMLVDPDSLTCTSYLWLGGGPGEPLPDLGDRIVRHTKGDASGAKAERPDLREVRRSRFQPVPDVDGLIERLFGTALERDRLRLRRHLREQDPVNNQAPAWLAHLQAGRFDAMPEALSADDSVQLAHLVNGYALAGLGGPEGTDHYVADTLARMDAGNSLPSGLWAALFFEHRRLRFEGREPDLAERERLVDLEQALRASVRSEGGSPRLCGSPTCLP